MQHATHKKKKQFKRTTKADNLLITEQVFLYYYDFFLNCVDRIVKRIHVYIYIYFLYFFFVRFNFNLKLKMIVLYFD